MKRYAGAAVALMVAGSALAASVPAQPAQAAQAMRGAQAMRASASSAPNAGNTPLDIVMLVDESGSLSDADVAREIQAAGTIAQTPLNPLSRVTIVGFGGVNGVAPNQDPTNVACQPTLTGGAVNLEYLARCVHGLHRRTEAQGDDTDYAAALAQAMSYLGPGTAEGKQSPAGATKAIFLMTDGGLDVHRDPQYLPDWLTAAHHAVNLQLAAARAAGVQVWPLGFGTISASDAQYLRYLAASGAQAACDTRAASRPHAIVVSDSAVALNALYSLYAAAGCLGRSSGGSTTVPAGQTRVLTVNIPAIASAGAISVDKGNPAVRVDYLTPSGTTVTGGSLGGSTFQRSGQDTAVDVLHITDPEAGAWQIRLTAPSGVHSQLISATAFWQGVVRASILAAPSTARVGQPIHVTLSVLGPNGPITDPTTLSQIHVQVSVTGDGLSGPTNVPVSNGGEGPGTATGVGDYDGTFTAPSTSGTLTFVGDAVGYGLHAVQVPQEVQVGTQSPMVAAVLFNAPASVQAGQTVPGRILFRNPTGASHRVLLTLTTAHALATIAAPQGVINVPSGNSGTSFVVTFAGNSPRGSAAVVMKVVGAANPSISYGAGQLIITVLSPPGLVGKYRWEIIGALLLLMLLALAFYARRRAHRAAVDVRGLYARLRDSRNDAVLSELKAPNKWSPTFPFVIRQEDDQSPRLDTRRPGEAHYVARRDVARSRRNPMVNVVTPEGEEYHVGIGGRGEEVSSGLLLAFREVSRAGTGGVPSSGPAGTGSAGSAEGAWSAGSAEGAWSAGGAEGAWSAVSGDAGPGPARPPVGPTARPPVGPPEQPAARPTEQPASTPGAPEDYWK